MPNHPRTLIALVAGLLCASTHAQQLPLCSQIPTLSTQECIVDGAVSHLVVGGAVMIKPEPTPKPRYTVQRETVDETGLPALIFRRDGKFFALKMYGSEKEARADEALWKEKGVIVR